MGLLPQIRPSRLINESTVAFAGQSFFCPLAESKIFGVKPLRAFLERPLETTHHKKKVSDALDNFSILCYY
jgi:hypothetical protein